jgi:hypothetical protein
MLNRLHTLTPICSINVYNQIIILNFLPYSQCCSTKINKNFVYIHKKVLDQQDLRRVGEQSIRQQGLWEL